MDDTSLSEVPDGVAGRAVADARRRRLRRTSIWATALGVSGLLIAGIVVVQSDASPRESTVAVPSAVSIPIRLPGPNDPLPVLEEPMKAASAAYLIDGELALVDAATREAGRFAGSGVAATSVSLSPDGTRAVLLVHSSSTDGDAVHLLDLASGQADLLEGVRVQTDGAGRIGSRVVAWAPDSRRFACVCVGDGGAGLEVIATTDAATWTRVSVEGDHHRTSAVAWGSVGIAEQEGPGGDWELASGDQFSDDSNPGAGEFTISNTSDSYLFAGAKYRSSPIGGVLVPGKDSAVDQYVEYTVGELSSSKSESHEVQGRLTGVGALADGFAVGIELPGAVQVLGVDLQGQSNLLTTMPLRASSLSFATDLVGTGVAQRDDPSADAVALPGLRGLPRWEDVPVQVASAAYITRGSLVLVDSETGEGSVVLLDVSPDDEILLSPDGRRLLLLDASGPGRMVVVDLATLSVGDGGHRWPLQERSAALAQPRVAWWGPLSILCVCGWDAVTDGPAGVYRLTVGDDGSLGAGDRVLKSFGPPGQSADGVAVGVTGFAVHEGDTQTWWLVHPLLGVDQGELTSARLGLGIGRQTLANFGLSHSQGWLLDLDSTTGQHRARVPIPGLPEQTVVVGTSGESFAVITGGDSAFARTGLEQVIGITPDGEARILATLPEDTTQATVSSDWLDHQLTPQSS